MNATDEAEVERLVSLLQRCEGGLPPASPAREALQKAALGLRLAFLRGLRSEIEALYAGIDRPLTSAERQHLRALGIAAPDGD